MLWIYFSFSCLLLLSIALAQPMNRGLPPLQNDNAINWDELQPLNTGSDPYQTSQLSWNEVLQDREPSPRPNTETNTDKPRSPTHSIMGVDPGKEKKAPRKRRKQKWTTASLIAGKKYYDKIKADPEKWQEYKAKKRKWYQSYVASQSEEKKEQIRARKARESKARKQNRRPDVQQKPRLNTRMRIRAKIENSTATEAEKERYQELLEKDRQYHREANLKKIQSGQIGKKGRLPNKPGKN